MAHFVYGTGLPRHVTRGPSIAPSSMQSAAPLQQHAQKPQHLLWQDRMLQIWREDSSADPNQEQRSVIALAKEILVIDREDQELQGGMTYRKAISQKDLELTASALHLIHPDVIGSLVKRDFRALQANSALLPDQLEAGDDEPDPQMKVTAAVYELEKWPDGRRPTEKRWPCIYVHFHCSEDGDNPSWNHYRDLIPDLEAYKRWLQAKKKNETPTQADDAVRRKIETVFFTPLNKVGQYTEYEPKDDKPRYAMDAQYIDQWIKVYRASRQWALNNGGLDANSAVPHALAEAGFTVAPFIRREAQSEHGGGGNTLMNLIEATMIKVLDDVGDREPRRYRMRHMHVAEIPQYDMAPAQERTISRLTSSYVTCGGTNTQLAGIQVQSAARVPANVWVDQCKKISQPYFESVEEDFDLISNKLDRARDVKQTQSNKAELKDSVDKADSLIQAVHSTRDGVENGKKQLMDAAGGWAERVSGEMDAVKQVDKLKELLSQTRAMSATS